MRSSDEIIDELARQSVSEEDLAERASAERSLLRRSRPVAALTASTSACLSELALYHDHTCFVAPVLDVTDLWMTGHDIRTQVFEAATALYMCTKWNTMVRCPLSRTELHRSFHEQRMISCQCWRWTLWVANVQWQPAMMHQTHRH